MHVETIAPWSQVWVWAVPLVVLNVIIHVAGLVRIRRLFAPAFGRHVIQNHLTLRVALPIAATVTAITVLHAAEAAVWAVAFFLLGATPDFPASMLYSIEAMTTYGHSPVELAMHWRLLGGIEALNGMILFGLTTAFLFAMLQPTVLFAQTGGPPTQERAPNK